MDPSLPKNGNPRLKHFVHAGIATVLAGVLIVSQAALAASAPSEKGMQNRSEHAAGAGERSGQERAAEGQEQRQAASEQASADQSSASSDTDTGSADDTTTESHADADAQPVEDNGSDVKAERNDAQPATQSQAPSGAGQQTAWEGPPGNNGTVKIDGIPFDDHPNNEPHPGCIFQVDFYNYDKGDLDATYSFALQQPTGTARLLSGTTFIGEDRNGGGRDLDASVTIDLTDALIASGAQPHPQQGFHVKLTVNAEGSIGEDVKHKVFWVECDITIPPQGGGEVPPPTTDDDTDVLGEQFERDDRGDRVEVMGAQFEQGLATTGADVRAALLLGLLLLISGGFLVKAGRQAA